MCHSPDKILTVEVNVCARSGQFWACCRCLCHRPDNFRRAGWLWELICGGAILAPLDSHFSVPRDDNLLHNFSGKVMLARSTLLQSRFISGSLLNGIPLFRPFYSKSGGKNRKHCWAGEASSITAVSYIPIQLFEYIISRHFRAIPQGMASFQITHLPLASFRLFRTCYKSRDISQSGTLSKFFPHACLQVMMWRTAYKNIYILNESVRTLIW
jgi:hypothetical protein